MKPKPFTFDPWTLFSFLGLVAIGVVMVASASMVISDRQFHYPFHYFLRQFIFLLIGLGLLYATTKIPMHFWRRYSRALMLISILMLLLVLVPGIGRVVNGSRRWLWLGVITLQVSEVVKLFALIFLASYLERFEQQVKYRLFGFVKPMIVLVIMAILLLAEPDFGSVAVLTAAFMAMLFLANVRLWPFIVLIVIVAGAMVLLAVESPYRLARITSFLNPWGHQFGSGYQLTQSLIAFGRGGFFGVGLGNSIQKLFYLPEAHTDFLFAVIAEELGFVGMLAIIALFVMLVGRIFKIAKQALARTHLFSGYLLMGIAVWLGLQAMINMGVNAGILPTKGLTLPFISYGGSSLLVNCVSIGIILRVYYENQLTGARIARRTLQGDLKS